MPGFIRKPWVPADSCQFMIRRARPGAAGMECEVVCEETPIVSEEVDPSAVIYGVTVSARSSRGISISLVV